MKGPFLFMLGLIGIIVVTIKNGSLWLGVLFAILCGWGIESIVDSKIKKAKDELRNEIEEKIDDIKNPNHDYSFDD